MHAHGVGCDFYIRYVLESMNVLFCSDTDTIDTVHGFDMHVPIDKKLSFIYVTGFEKTLRMGSACDSRNARF